MLFPKGRPTDRPWRSNSSPESPVRIQCAHILKDPRSQAARRKGCNPPKTPIAELVTGSSCWKLWTPEPPMAAQNFWLNVSAILRWAMMSLESGVSQLGLFWAEQPESAFMMFHVTATNTRRVYSFSLGLLEPGLKKPGRLVEVATLKALLVTLHRHGARSAFPAMLGSLYPKTA